MCGGGGAAVVIRCTEKISSAVDDEDDEEETMSLLNMAFVKISQARDREGEGERERDEVLVEITRGGRGGEEHGTNTSLATRRKEVAGEECARS
jgi:hypothetical protein